MIIDAMDLNYQELNRQIGCSPEPNIIIKHCNGQRYIANGQKEKDITIYGTPGNALGAYLCGGRITVYGNVQEATGDTMDNGTICIHGNAGDGTGYAMRGGKIFVRGNIGYRAGIHMKAYRDKSPVLVVGGSAGSFLGEYHTGAPATANAYFRSKNAVSSRVRRYQSCRRSPCSAFRRYLRSCFSKGPTQLRWR